MLRGDIARLSRCTKILIADANVGDIKRSKPFKYAYEKDIVLYAYYKKLDYFSTECTYSPGAYRGFARSFIKDVERERPSSILDIIRSGESFEVKEEVVSATATPSDCERCGYMTSGQFCKACILLEGLNRGLPKMGITRRGTRALKESAEPTDAATKDITSETQKTISQQQEQQHQQQQQQKRQLERFSDIAVDLEGVIR